MIDHQPRNHHVLGKRSFPPEIGGRDSQHLPVVAEVDLSFEAVLTLAAVDCRVEGDAVALPEILDVRSYRRHGPRGLMPHNDGRDPPTR